MPKPIDFLQEEATGLPGAFSQYDMMALYPALQEMGPEAVYLEVGVRRGRSLLFARKHSQGHVYGIDIGHEIQLDAFQGYEYWHFIHKASNEAVKSWELPIDVLFIDGDHTYEGVSDDWHNFSPFVKPGGIVYFHDCDTSSPDVLKFFGEIADGWEKTVWREKLDGRNTSICSVRRAA